MQRIRGAAAAGAALVALAAAAGADAATVSVSERQVQYRALVGEVNNPAFTAVSATRVRVTDGVALTPGPGCQTNATGVVCNVARGVRAVTADLLNLGDSASIDTSGALISLVAFGGDGADTLTGGGAGDYLDGGAGIDSMHGNAGSDNIFSNDGNVETNISCGAGNRDVWVRDAGDRESLRGCEIESIV